MDYQVWIKDDFGDTYTKVDCGDLAAARRVIDTAVRTGGDPILTVEVPYSMSIKVEAVGTEKPKRKIGKKEMETEIKEEPEVEASQSETEASEDPGAES